jgi:hypothetical protein
MTQKKLTIVVNRMWYCCIFSLSFGEDVELSISTYKPVYYNISKRLLYWISNTANQIYNYI